MAQWSALWLAPLLPRRRRRVASFHAPEANSRVSERKLALGSFSSLGETKNPQIYLPARASRPSLASDLMLLDECWRWLLEPSTMNDRDWRHGLVANLARDATKPVMTLARNLDAPDVTN